MLTDDVREALEEKVRAILSKRGRALRVECLRENAHAQYEFRVWLMSSDASRSVIVEVPRRFLDDGDETEVDRLVVDVALRLSFDASGNPPLDVSFTQTQLTREQTVLAAAETVGTGTAAEITKLLLARGLVEGPIKTVLAVVNRLLDYLTLRTPPRLFMEPDGRYRKLIGLGDS